MGRLGTNGFSHTLCDHLVDDSTPEKILNSPVARKQMRPMVRLRSKTGVHPLVERFAVGQIFDRFFQPKTGGTAMKIRTSRRSRNVVLEMEPKNSTLPPVSVPELRLKRILTPVDFSECSRKALQY